MFNSKNPNKFIIIFISDIYILWDKNFRSNYLHHIHLECIVLRKISIYNKEQNKTFQIII